MRFVQWNHFTSHEIKEVYNLNIFCFIHVYNTYIQNINLYRLEFAEITHLDAQQIGEVFMRPFELYTGLLFEGLSRALGEESFAATRT